MQPATPFPMTVSAPGSDVLGRRKVSGQAALAPALGTGFVAIAGRGGLEEIADADGRLPRLR